MGKKSLLNNRFNKIYSIIFFSLCSISIFCLILFALKQNINLFYTPTQIVEEGIKKNKNIKIGGFVKKNSVKMDDYLNIFFDVTDYKHSISIEYNGILPDLFDDNKGVVVIGYFKDNNVLKAKQILAKHDENYVSKNIINSIDLEK